MPANSPQSVSIDLTYRTPAALGRHLRSVDLSPKDVGAHLKRADRQSDASVYTYTRAILGTQQSRDQFVAEGSALFQEAMKLGPQSRREVLRAVVDETGRAGGLFIIQNLSMLKQRDARTGMRDYFEAGGQVGDVAEWLQLAGQVLRAHNIKPSDTAGAVVDAIGDAAEWVVDALEDGVDALLEGIDAIIDAITDAGAAIVDLFEEVVSWTAEQMGNLLAALIEAGRALGEFIGATFDWAYAAVSTFVRAAFDVGLAIAELLENVVDETYWVLRRFVNGIIENLGPVGEILDFVLTQIEDATSELWRRTLLALRYAEARLTDALDWMAEQTSEVFEAIVRAWESIGESLIDLYEWALDAGAVVWRAIGEATATIGNSIWYAYNFLSTSGVQFIFDFTRGLLRAGMAVAEFLGWALEQSIVVLGHVLRAAMDAGTAIAELLVEVATEPGNAMNAFVEAMQDIGQTLDDLLQAAVIDTAEAFLDEVVRALLELGNAVVDILEAGLRLGGAALAILVADLLNRLGSYRPMRPQEIADARTVFGDSLDYDLIFLSTEDPVNEILFGVQDFFTQNPDSRAFVTSNLINFDVDDGDIDRPTLIHELTHVWQSREVGGIYMAEAIAAQATGDGVNGDGYNYGYTTTNVAAADSLNIVDHYDGTQTNYRDLGFILGEGGDNDLQAANGDFEAFNREQQGQILMHWFVRTQLPITDNAGSPVVRGAAAWNPYQQFVFNS